MTLSTARSRTSVVLHAHQEPDFPHVNTNLIELCTLEECSHDLEIPAQEDIFLAYMIPDGPLHMEVQSLQGKGADHPRISQILQ
jgi:hypothetical protein